MIDSLPRLLAWFAAMVLTLPLPLVELARRDPARLWEPSRGLAAANLAGLMLASALIWTA